MNKTNEKMNHITKISMNRQEHNKKKLIKTKDVELYNILMAAEGKWFTKKHKEVIAEILNGKQI